MVIPRDYYLNRLISARGNKAAAKSVIFLKLH